MDSSEHTEADPQALARMIELAGNDLGIDWGRYKEATLLRQVVKRCRTVGLASLDRYAEFLRAHEDERGLLLRALAVSVTAFFRDPDAFRALSAEIRKNLAGKRPGDSIRVWVPACAAGQEAYSIAMLVAEFLGDRLSDHEVRVFATDVDAEAIEQARAGAYSREDVASIRADRLDRWFKNDGGEWRIDATIRDLCTFAVHDVLSQPPFIHVDVVSCRNLLIYLRPERQEELLDLFHYSLGPGGLLLLGQSESAGLETRRFDTIDATHRLYRRREVSDRDLPRTIGRRTGYAPARRLPLLHALSANHGTLTEAALEIIAREHGPASVLTDQDYQPVRFFGRSKDYFSLPSGESGPTLFALCSPPLRDELHVLFHRVAHDELNYAEGIAVGIRAGDRLVRVRPIVRRVEPASAGVHGGFLVSFEELDSRGYSAASDESVGADPGAAELRRLREDLAASRAQLQSVIEAMESSQDELQLLREEVQTTGEELQASNEELRSSNDELRAVNDQLRRKSFESEQLNATLVNVQNSMRASLVVIDRHERLARYNALATRVFGLVDGDVGRSIHDVPCQLPLTTLRRQLRDVILDGRSVVERVRQGDYHYVMQIDPYRDEAGTISGAVLIFSDVSELRRAEVARERSEAMFREVWEGSREGLMVMDGAQRIVLANPAASRIFGRPPSALSRSSLHELVPEQVPDDVVPQSPETTAVGLSAPTVRATIQRADGREISITLGMSELYLEGAPHTLAIVRDVTERLRVESALRDREFKLAAIVEHSPSALSLKDTEGVYVLANPNLQRIHGCPEADIVGKSDFDLYPAGTARAFRDNDRIVLETGHQRSVEEIVPVDGEPRVFISHMFPICDVDRKPQFVCRISLDITDRKRAEVALVQSERRLRLALDAAHAGGWEWHLETHQNHWSDEVWNLYGLDRDGVEPSFETWRGSVHPDDRETVTRTVVDAAERLAEFEVEWRVNLPADRTPRYLLARGRPVAENGGPVTRYIGIVIDISARRRAVAELESYKESLEALVDDRTAQLSELYHRAPCGYHSLDPAGRYVAVNDTELSWLGYSREQLVGRKRPSDLMPPESALEFEAAMRRLTAASEVRGVEVDLRRDDGTLLPVLLQARAVRGDDGSLLHTLWTLTDNTDRKRVEQALTAARDAAEAASRSKSAFVANMSHEIRTPLNAIIGLTRLMKRSADAGAHGTRLGKVDDAAQHLLSIVNDILDLSKIEAGRFSLENSPVELPEIVSGVVDMVKDRASRKGLILAHHSDPLPPALRGDPTRVKQALLNLVGNAVKFTEHGRIDIRIRRMDDRDDRVLIRVEVEDTGVGIEPDLLARLFTPFEQGDVSTTRRYGGTGLGLAITRRLAQLMGGEAGATSDPGIGSVFWFSAWLSVDDAVRRSDDAVPAVAHIEAAIARDHRGAKVLLADDDPINREIAESFLIGAGLSVQSAANGAEAVDMARHRRFDLVLMDMQMPVLDGIAATREIRALPGWQDVPIVALTANVFADDRAACLASGMNDFVAKPFEPDGFLLVVARWLRRSPAVANDPPLDVGTLGTASAPDS